MVTPALIPVPFVLAMLYSLLVRRRHAGYVACVAALVTFGIVLLAEPSDVLPWFSVGGVEFSFSFVLDKLGLLLASIVAGIGTFVFLYSVGYLEKNESHGRYYFLMCLFATSMLGVVLAGDLFQLIFFWELVGVSSYLLIGFWHHKERAMNAARKALLTIIVGDTFFLAGILLLWFQYRTMDIQTILASLQPDTATVLAGVGILVGAMSKSAQFPLHDWLPDAMEGPTPVSAFLHSATMVKAGLYVLARFLPLMLVAGLLPWIIAIAAITIIVSACTALVETDIKRVLAYSTINQLGFIALALGLGAIAAGMFHLLTHSIFKALLFFCAGVAIHTAGTQDLRKIKILPRWNVFTISVVAASLSLAGLVPLAGFFSKEGIFSVVEGTHEIALILLFAGAIVLSAAYIARWFFLQFSKKGSPAKSPWQMMATLPVLALGAAFAGMFAWQFFGWWGVDVPHYAGFASVVSTILVLLGIGVVWAVVSGKVRIEWLSRSGMAEFFRERFLMDKLYTLLGNYTQKLARVITAIDGTIINRSARGIGTLALRIGSGLQKLQSGHAPAYICAMVFGFVLLVVLLGVLA